MLICLDDKHRRLFRDYRREHLHESPAGEAAGLSNRIGVGIGIGIAPPVRNRFRTSILRSWLPSLPEYRTQLLDGGFQQFGRVMTLTPGFGDFDIRRFP